jgi:DNA/RNA-binding domain of Phe-tRNA-synthetase-like protein
MTIQLSICESLPNLHVGVLEIVGVRVQPASEALRKYCEEVAIKAAERFDSKEYNEQCQEVRQLLRFGRFKASGRSKPAQEYLAGCVSRDGHLPSINGPVDLLNAVSLQFNLPISLLSLAKCSRRLHVSRGNAGETYVFNSVGQTLDLTDLITTYDASSEPARPVGTPIKDSLAGKIEATDQDLVAIVYCPNSESARRRCDSALEQLKTRMRHCMG